MKGQRRETEFDERDRTESERAKNCISSARRNARDVISTLPDSLLCHILSFLPTPDAIRTSILSSRWRPLWTLLPILNFNHQDIPQITHPLEDIVSSVLTLRNTGPDPAPIHKLRIFLFQCCVSTHLETWVVAASIRLCFSALLPSLKIMKLESVSYANRDSLSTLLAACPFLRDLTLKLSPSRLPNYKYNGIGTFSVNAIILIPTLKRLHFHWPIVCWPYKVHINTPALEYFHFNGVLNEDFVLEKLPNVVESVVEIVKFLRDVDYAKKVWDFMGQFCNVISMELITNTAETLSYASNRDNIPMFHNLSSLSFSVFHFIEWHAIQLLLHRAPKLQILVVKPLQNYVQYGIRTDGYLKELLTVPECLSSHLTTFHYNQFSGNEYEMEFVRQLLMAAGVLKTMRITVKSALDSEVKLQVHEKLSEYQRSSQSCQIAFD
nr:f-box/fbd/lrr-repeat protein [Quercus suber]